MCILKEFAHKGEFLKNFFCHFRVSCKDRADKGEHSGCDGSDGSDRDHEEPAVLTVGIGDRAEAVRAANGTDVTAGVKEGRDAADVAVFADGKRNDARRDIDDTADHEIHEREEEDGERGVFLRIEEKDRENGKSCNGIEQSFEEEVAVQAFFQPFNEERTEDGDLGQDHREDHGNGIGNTEIVFQDRRQPRNDTVADEGGARRADAGENEDENEIFREKLHLRSFSGRLCRGDGCFFFKNGTVVMEDVFRTANTEEPCERHDENECRRKIENDAPGKSECADACGDTVANEIAEAIGHAVPDDGAADIFSGKEFGLDVEDIAPKRALRDTVDEPDIFHRLDGRRERETEITKRGDDQ